MKRELTDLALIVGLVLFWITGVFLAVASVWPVPAEATRVAWLVAIPAAMGALLLYLLLWAVGQDREGLPIFLLFAFPFVCIIFSVPWWILKAMELWPPPR